MKAEKKVTGKRKIRGKSEVLPPFHHADRKTGEIPGRRPIKNDKRMAIEVKPFQAGDGWLLAESRLAMGLSGRLARFSLQLKLRGMVPVSVFLLATLLILRGLSLGIPYVSPDLASGHAACCRR